MAGTSRDVLTLSVRVASDRVQDDLVKYAVDFRLELAQVIRQQMRLLVTDLMKLTPPFRSRAARGESWAQQRRIGELAMARDIERIFEPIDSIAMRNQTLGTAITAAIAQDNMAVLGLGTSLPELMVKAHLLDTPDTSKILDAPDPLIHQRLRIRGRVRGRLPFKYFVKSTAALKEFIISESGMVGYLKAGWGAAAQKFEAKAPEWIERHFLMAGGEVVDRSNDEENPYAIARNTVPYIEAQNSDLRIVGNALQDRANSMERAIQGHANRLRKI